MKLILVLFLICAYLDAADVEMMSARRYSSEQFSTFCAMQTAAKFFFQLIDEKNDMFAQEAKAVSKRCADVTILPSSYTIKDSRSLGLSFPRRRFYVTQGLLFDAKQLSFVSSLGTWQFACNGSFVHRCFKDVCKSCACVNKNACTHRCKYYDYRQFHPWQDIFKDMMKTESYNEVEGLLKVVEVHGVRLSAPKIVRKNNNESPEVSPSILRDYSYEEQKDVREQRARDELAVLHDYRWDDSEPDMFKTQRISRARSLSDGVKQTAHELMRRLSLTAPQEVPEVITDPQEITPAQAKVIWAAMCETKKKLDADAEQKGYEYAPF